MAVNVATLVATLDAETRGFQTKFDQADRRIDQFDRNSRRATGGLDSGLQQSERKVSGLGRTIRRAGGLLVAAFGARKIAQTFGASVNAAADLDESINAIEQVLGAGADSFIRFGRDSSSALGITQAALNEAVVPMAALLDNAGIKGDELSENLQTLSTRATDVASVFNKDVNTVLEAFGSALRGEQEPARQFGVNISAAAVQAEALASGLIQAGEEMDETAKAQATLNLIMEQTDRTAGDFARTADQLPNLMRRVGATATDLSAAFGSGLLGGAEDATGSLLRGLEDLKPVVEDAGDRLGEAFGPVLEQGIDLLLDMSEDALPALVDAAVPVAAVLEDMLRVMSAMEPVMGPVIDVLGKALGLIEKFPSQLLLNATLDKLDQVTGNTATTMKHAAVDADVFAASLKQMAVDAGHLTGEGEDNSRTMEELGESYMETRRSARDLTESVESLIDRLNEQAGVALDAESADIRFRDSLAELNAELAEGQRTLDLATDAGRRNREAFVDAAESALNHAAAMEEADADISKVNQTLMGHSRQLREAGRQAGFSEDEITELLRSFQLLPDQIAIRMDVDVRNALRDIERVTGAVARATQTHGIEVGHGRGRFVERAHGGRLGSGQTALVGEEGPELFQPDTAGTVIPNGSFGGGMPPVNITVHGSVLTERELVDIVQQGIRQSKRRSGTDGFDI